MCLPIWSRTRTEMKGRVQMIHEDQDRDLENWDQRRKNTVSKKGNTQGYTEIGDETRLRMRMRSRVRMRRDKGETRTRTRMRTRRDEDEDKDETRAIE